MIAVVGATAAAYYTASVSFIMSFVFQSSTTTSATTELAYSLLDSPCAGAGHDHRNSQQTWRLLDGMQRGPKEPNPVGTGGGCGGGGCVGGGGGGNGGGVSGEGPHRSLLTPLLERITLWCTLIALFVRWFWVCGFRRSPPPALPQLNFRPSSLLKFVLKTCESLREPFTPVAWAWFGHLQTVIAFILSDSTMRYRREVLQMNDGGVVALDWAARRRLKKEQRKNISSKGIIIILPDLVASSSVVSRLCSSVCCSGYEPVVFHRRGTSGLPLSTPKSQSLGDPSDLRDVVRYLKSKLPSRKRINAIGLGFGGSLLLSYLGNYGSSSRLSAAVCISPVYDLQAAVQTDQRTPLFNWLILQFLKLNFTNHVNTMPPSYDLDAAFSCKALHEWLEKVDCPMYKLKELDDYWEHNEPLRDADEIAVPLLCINSFDDPITRKESIPYDLFSTLPNLLLVTTDRGGHCGFMQDSLYPVSWAHGLSLDFIGAVLQFTENVTNERIVSGRIRIDS